MYQARAMPKPLAKTASSQVDDEEDDPFDVERLEEDMMEEQIPYLTLDNWMMTFWTFSNSEHL